MSVEVNWLAIVLATASSMVVGAVWYTPKVFGKIWIKLGRLKESELGRPGYAIPVTVVVSFLTAYVLAHVTYLAHNFFGNTYLQDAMSTGFWLWLGFTAARFITHDAFEGRRKKLTLLNISHELVTILLMSLIIGLLKP